MTRSVVAADALPQLRGGGAASEGPRARTLAGLSLLLWAAAITAGRLMAYIGPTQAEAGIQFGAP